MLRNPKIQIQKKVQLDDKGHFRFYHVPYQGFSEKIGSFNYGGFIHLSKNKKKPVFHLDRMSFIQTEKDLIKFIYDAWGEGIYLCWGHSKGIRGHWTFWHGEINSKGFMFYKKNYNRKDVDYWAKQEREESDNEYKSDMQELKEEARREAKAKSKNRRYGFKPFLERSSNRGELRFWDDDKLILKPENENDNDQETWVRKEEKKEPDSWGEVKKEDNLEKW